MGLGHSVAVEGDVGGERHGAENTTAARRTQLVLHIGRLPPRHPAVAARVPVPCRHPELQYQHSLPPLLVQQRVCLSQHRMHDISHTRLTQQSGTSRSQQSVVRAGDSGAARTGSTETERESSQPATTTAVVSDRATSRRLQAVRSARCRPRAVRCSSQQARAGAAAGGGRDM